MHINITKHYLWVISIIFIEGFVTISAEIFTIRQLMPVVGSNVIVTSMIIGAFLLFLAYGYKQGGAYKGNFKKILKRNFLIAAALIGIGLSYLFVDSFFTLFKFYLNTPTLLALTFYLILITSPLVFFLGQTVPITMNFFSKEERSSKIGANVLHLSTLGSFLGSILTSLLLLNFLGVAWTIFINFSLLIVLILLVIDDFLDEIISVSIVIFLLMVSYGMNVQAEKHMFTATNSYANYEVLKNVAIAPDNIGTLLRLNNSNSSFIGKNKKSFPYIELIKKILFKDLKLHDKSILVLGAGGFSLSAEKTLGNHFTYVDIDPALKPNVCQFMDIVLNGSFIADDARSFLKETKNKYNVIISDVYNNRTNIPAHLLTYQHFINIRNHLTQKGIAIFNIIANPFLADKYSKRIDNTIRKVFPNCMAIPLNYSDKPTNIIYLCKRSGQESDNIVYTDNLNQANLDSFQLGRAHESII